MKIMQTINQQIKMFNMNRFYKMLKIEINKYRQTYFIIYIVLASIYILFNFPSKNFITPPEAFFVIGLIIGVFFTSKIFTEFNNKDRAAAYIMVPASNIEKWSAKLLISSIGYYSILFSLFFVLILFFAIIKGTLSGLKINYPLSLLPGFMFFHAVFFFGAIFFKKNNFFKTLLLLILTLIIINVVFLLFNKVFINMDLLNGYKFHFNYRLNSSINFFNRNSISIIIYSAVTFLLYTFSFISFNKKEVK